MYACDHCGKSSQVGMNVSHSHVRTKKRSKPNLHRTTLVYGGRRQSMRLCTKCLRLAKKKSAVGYNGEAKGKAKVIQTSSSPQVESVKLKKKESHTLSEDIMKAATSTKKEPAKTAKS